MFSKIIIAKLIGYYGIYNKDTVFKMHNKISAQKNNQNEYQQIINS